MTRTCTQVGLVAACAVLLAGCGWRQHRDPAGEAMHAPYADAWRLFAEANDGSGGGAQWQGWPIPKVVYSNTPLPRDDARAMETETSRESPTVVDFGGCGQWERDETVHMNWSAADYVRAHGFQDVVQVEAQAEGAVDFPIDAIEVKLGWLAPPRPGQIADTTEYAMRGGAPRLRTSQVWRLGGMHIFSKAIPKWFFATFESTCVQAYAGEHNLRPLVSPPQEDTFGYPGGGMSAELERLFQRHRLDPGWRNYRLVGVQTGFYTAQGAPIELGNRVLEAGLKAPSCMGCHAAAGMSKNGVVAPGMCDPTTGAPDAAALQDRVLFDFAWSMENTRGATFPTPGTGKMDGCRSPMPSTKRSLP